MSIKHRAGRLCLCRKAAVRLFEEITVTVKRREEKATQAFRELPSQVSP
jgi:hypothetical protein